MLQPQNLASIAAGQPLILEGESSDADSDLQKRVEKMVGHWRL